MMRIGWLLMAFFSIGNLDASLWPNCIYLATFPRSGNHWVRYMLEELTGKVTGSVYCDQDHPVHSPIILPMGGYAPDFGYEGCREYPVDAFYSYAIYEKKYKRVNIFLRHFLAVT